MSSPPIPFSVRTLLACAAYLAGFALCAAAPAASSTRVVLGQPAHLYPVATELARTSLRALPSAIPLSGRPVVAKGGSHLVLKLRPNEKIHGLGQQFLDWDLRGRAIDTWLRDRIHGGWGSSYFASPFFISSAGYGVFVNCTGKVRFDFGKTDSDELRIEAPEGGLDVYFFTGTPAEIVRAYTAVVGRAPEVPDWVFRLWISRNSYLSAGEIDTILDRATAERIPVGVVVLEAWAETLQSFTFESDRYPDAGDWIKSLHARDTAAVLWITPSTWTSSPIYRDAVRRGFLVRDADGAELIVDWLEGGRKIDFSQAAARDWWTALARPLVQLGVDGFKTDGGERNPDPFFHNLQPFHYQEATVAAFADDKRPGVTFARSASATSTRTGTFWAGDQDARWSSLDQAVRSGLGAGLSGFAYYGHDIGGYLGTPHPDLYIRWYQLGAFSPIMQWHGIGAREPWEFGPEAVEVARYYTQLRERMLPYLKETARQARANGTPMMRPLLWAHPEDEASWAVDDQFYLGDELLVAPILTDSGRRDIYLPPGRWRDLFTGLAHTGPVRLDGYDAPLRRIPVFVREAEAEKWLALRGALPDAAPAPAGVEVAIAGPLDPQRGLVRPVQIAPDRRGLLAWDVTNRSASARRISLRLVPETGLALVPDASADHAPAADFTLAPGQTRRVVRAIELTADTPAGWTRRVEAVFTSDAVELFRETRRFALPAAWRVAGPFAGTVRQPDISFVTAPSQAWSEVAANRLGPDGEVSFRSALSLSNEPNGSYYATTTLFSPGDTDARLHFGAGDAVTVWVNGEQVFDHADFGNFYADSHSCAVRLQAGENRILIRHTRQIGAPIIQLRAER